MIAMFVGDQNRVDMLGTFPAKRFKPPEHFFAAESGINQESRAPGFEQRGVARAAWRQNRYAERDAALSVRRRGDEL